VTKRYKIHVTATAQADLEQIYCYIAQDSPNEAGRFITQIEKAMVSLATLPERHALIPENQFFGTDYRHLTYKKYRIIYRVAKNEVFILRIFQGSKLLDL
jgi:toxin ParE1/3/4